MSLKKQTIAVATAVSLVAANIGYANFASADIAPDGTWQPAPGVTCAEAQNAINNLDEHASSFNTIQHSIRITENCSANLVIPSGKTVLLSLYSEDENGEREYHHLTNDGGDTITVEEGASFYYESSDTPDEYISNTTSGRSIINNKGKVHILTGTFRAENGAYTATNSGELNVHGNNFIGTNFRNNNGVIRITGGTFDNPNNIRGYVVKGTKLDEATNRVISALPNEEHPLRSLWNTSLDKKIPIGSSFSIMPEYSDYAEATETAFSYVQDSSVLKITGSNKEGWTFTAIGVGSTTLGLGAIYVAGDAGQVTVFDVAPSTSNELKNTIANIVNSFVGTIADAIQQAIESGKTISLTLNIDRQATIEDAEKEQIAEVAGEDQILGYYDISLALKGDDEKLADITDLGEDDVEARLPADFLNDLETVKDGYKRNYYVIRYHEGAAEKIDAKLEGEELVFRSGKFSTYAVAYTDTQTSGDSSDDNSGDNNTDNTGSNSNTNNDSNNNQNSSSNSNSSTDNSGAKAPNTGFLAYFSNGEASVALVGVLVLAIVSGLFTFKAISRKQRK